jgi:hypothetical protein
VVTATGWLLLSVPRDVLDVGSDLELIFVSLLRNDLAISAGISMNGVSVVSIEEAVANEEGEAVHVHVSVELTASGNGQEASMLLQELINQSTDSTSQLFEGSVTSSVEYVGEEPGTASPCEAVFLGPDIGFVNVMEYHDSDGTCTLSMAELATVCSASHPPQLHWNDVASY